MKIGEKFKVIKEGSRLTWEVPSGRYCYIGKEVKLPVGAIITYIGTRDCPGSDPIPVDNFEYNGSSGEFWPNSWGVANKAYFEKID